MQVEELRFLISQIFGSRTTQRINRPIIKDGSSAIFAAKPFLIHTSFSIFLTEIEHKRILLHQYGGNQRRNSLVAITGKEIARNTLFIMIFQEIEHVITDIVSLLPCL